jgi:hypothetical protein
MNSALFVKDGQGNVAVAFYQNRPHWIDVLGGRKYRFDTRAMGICLAWIPEYDVQAVLNTPGGCGCPGEVKKVGAYRLANELQAHCWSTNNASARLPV